MTKSIWAVTFNNNIISTIFFEKKEDAQDDLKSIAKDRKNRPGVTVVEETEMKFSFILGWEQHHVTFSIVEIPLKAK